MKLDDAIALMREKPEFKTLVRDAYLGADHEDSAVRFFNSCEFAETLKLVGSVVQIDRKIVLDLGAGTGIASKAWVSAGAAKVIAVEPDPSALVGREALRRLCSGLPVEILADFAECLSLEDCSVDLVYTRQVLHHTRDLGAALRECARVLRPGGIFVACREHVADNETELREFLANHPIHKLAGGENAFPAARYREAIVRAGLLLKAELGQWDSLINAYPTVVTARGLNEYHRVLLKKRFGALGTAASNFPLVRRYVWRRIRRPRGGRLHSYLAVKPMGA